MIRKRGDRYEVVVYKGRDANGRRQSISRSVKTKRAALALQGELVRELDEGRRLDGADATLDHLHAKWLERVPQESTRYQAERAYARYVRPTLGPVPICRVMPSDLDGLYLRLLKGYPGQSPLAASSVRKVHTNLRAAFGLAVRWRWISYNPAVSAKPPEGNSTDPTAPAPAVVRALMAKAAETDPELVTFLRLAASTGKRRGELCALRRSDVDLDVGTLRVSRALGVAKSAAYEKQTKTGHRQTIALGGPTLTALRDHLTLQDERAAEFGLVLGPGAHLFTNDVEGREPWHPHAVTRRYVKLRKLVPEAAGVQLRQLRHFMVTEGLEHASVRTVAGRAGHARTSTTTDKYAAFLPVGDRDLADRLDELLNGG